MSWLLLYQPTGSVLLDTTFPRSITFEVLFTQHFSINWVFLHLSADQQNIEPRYFHQYTKRKKKKKTIIENLRLKDEIWDHMVSSIALIFQDLLGNLYHFGFLKLEKKKSLWQLRTPMKEETNFVEFLRKVQRDYVIYHIILPEC